ncbi:MAG: amino acid ABC transporter permease [Hyphomicrobiaceae bacterium]|nr:amino acid ABC transporter permease [Hyphomicrobiaceae bacterium]
MTTDAPSLPAKRKSMSLIDHIYDPRSRGIILQVLLAVALIWFTAEIVNNAITNLKKQSIASGFDFLGRTSGFDISQSLISYSNTMTYARAFWVGLLNTLLVAGLGIVLATIIGFIVGIGRLSTNWIIAKLASVYVEVLRNIPPLLMLFAIYFAVLKSLPAPRDSIELPFYSYLNVRGLTVPMPTWLDGIGYVVAAFFIAIVAAVLIARWARIRQEATGERFPGVLVGIGLVVLAPLLTFLLAGRPVSFEYPTPGRFNLSGGVTMLPEFVALLTGLTLYTAAFIAEIVRSGILGVSKGQKEAAAALGLRPGQSMRLVVIPQALRIIIPPLTNQYLNLTKNSSLAVAIGYPDLVSVFAGTVLNQTNQAIEVILITMAVYLVVSLLTSFFMNWFNSRMALVER